MYKEGDKVKYKTAHIRTQNRELMPQEKIGIVSEAFSTIDNRPCYWIHGEPELIFGSQVLGIA